MFPSAFKLEHLLVGAAPAEPNQQIKLKQKR